MCEKGGLAYEVLSTIASKLNSTNDGSLCKIHNAIISINIDVKATTADRSGPLFFRNEGLG